MGEAVGENDGEVLASIDRGGRPSSIDKLFNTTAGKEQFQKLLVMLASRSSLKAAALCIGITPDTLTRWIQKGKANGDSVYGKFYRECVSAISHAVVDAEMDINQQKPEFYLTRGPGKLIVGDIYNVDASGELEYGLDGTVSPAGQSTTSISSNNSIADEQQQQNAIEHEANQIDDALALDAMQSMADLGIDVGDAINKQLKKKEENNNEA